jgi:peptidoglycan/xylan/chitin deacetylase (PgdA/CDA1 family)
MKKSTLNMVLYILAAGFLFWHLFPVFSVGKAIMPRQKTNAELASDTTCYGSDINVPSFGDPLEEPIIHTLNQRQNFITPARHEQAITLDPFPSEVSKTNEKSWQPNSYGQNNTKFSVLSEAKNSSILKVEISDYKDGDGKWQTPILPVETGQSLRLTNEYRASTSTTANVTMIDADGSNQFVTLSHLKSTDSWQAQTVDLVIPDDVVAVRFSIILDTNGWLETRNYRVTSYSTPQFERGIVSFTFDDGWKSIYEQGLPLFEKYNIKTTQFVVADYEGNQAYMSAEQIRKFQDLGHDIGSHSLTHADHRTLNNADLMSEVNGSHTVLNTKFGGVNNYATPFGRYNDSVSEMIKRCYQSHRTTDTGFNAPGYDRFSIRVHNVEVDTKPEEIQYWAEFARDNNLWLVLVYHQVEDGGTYSVDTRALENHLNAVKETGIHTANFEEALLETYPQGR